MMPAWRVAVLVTLLAAPVIGAQALATEQDAAAQQDDERLPRFRGGANLVRVDAYVTADGEPVTDLTARDFEILEDGVPQRIESFQLVRHGAAAGTSTPRDPATVQDAADRVRDGTARVITLFLDVWHVQLEGAWRARGPLSRVLSQLLGPDDLVGVMTPEISARNIVFSPRTASIEDMLERYWDWGQRGRLVSTDAREEEIRQCYPDRGETAGIAGEMIRRRRESRTLDALEDLVVHLEGLREERKFVLLLSEGWLLGGPDERLARTLRDPRQGAGGPPLPTAGTDPGGRIRMDRDPGRESFSACERERAMLAFSDHEAEFNRLLQRANRANVSFYPVDARGVVAFDAPIGPERPPAPRVDAARLGARRTALRTLAENTDGYAIVDTDAIDEALARLVRDSGAYYLLAYYSTNTRLDGRFRQLTVRVTRPDVEIRARPGYLAPTEAELASERVERLVSGAPPGHTTIRPTALPSLGGLTPNPAGAPLRVHTAGAPGHIWVVGELDLATLRPDDWEQGARVRVSFEHDRGGAPPLYSEVTLDPGQHAFHVSPPPDAGVVPGRYVVRVQVHAGASAGTDTSGPTTPESASGSLVPARPLQVITDVTVPESMPLLSSTGLVSRRAPWTGREYVPTADARFRRTERIRFEVPRGERGTARARLLGRDGEPLKLTPTVSERLDTGGQRFVVVDLTLAPLAQGQYAIEVIVDDGDRSETAVYAFRLVP